MTDRVAARVRWIGSARALASGCSCEVDAFAQAHEDLRWFSPKLCSSNLASLGGIDESLIWHTLMVVR